MVRGGRYTLPSWERDRGSYSAGSTVFSLSPQCVLEHGFSDDCRNGAVPENGWEYSSHTHTHSAES